MEQARLAQILFRGQALYHQIPFASDFTTLKHAKLYMIHKIMYITFKCELLVILMYIQDTFLMMLMNM